jgi:hypothetical protein
MESREQVKIIFDPTVNSLTVRFGSAADEDIATQLADDLIVMKNRQGEIIGFEKHFFGAAPGHVQVQLETLALLTLGEITGDLSPEQTGN